jgi:DMSO reductase anchor subunit
MALASDTAWLAPVAALTAIAGLFVERWLFFAEARHTVAAFFPPTQA